MRGRFYLSFFIVFFAGLLNYLLAPRNGLLSQNPSNQPMNHNEKISTTAALLLENRLADNIQLNPVSAVGHIESSKNIQFAEEKDEKKEAKSNKIQHKEFEKSNSALALFDKLLTRSESIKDLTKDHMQKELRSTPNIGWLADLLRCYLASPNARFMFHLEENKDPDAGQAYNVETEEIEVYTSKVISFFNLLGHELTHACLRSANAQGGIELTAEELNDQNIDFFSRLKERFNRRMKARRSPVPYDIKNLEQRKKFRSALEVGLARLGLSDKESAKKLIYAQKHLDENYFQTIAPEWVNDVAWLLRYSISEETFQKLNPKLQKIFNGKTVSRNPKRLYQYLCSNLRELLVTAKNPEDTYRITQTLEILKLIYNITLSAEAKEYYMDMEMSAYASAQFIGPDANEFTEKMPEFLSYMRQRIEISVERQKAYYAVDVNNNKPRFV